MTAVSVWLFSLLSSHVIKCQYTLISLFIWPLISSSSLAGQNLDKPETRFLLSASQSLLDMCEHWVKERGRNIIYLTKLEVTDNKCVPRLEPGPNIYKLCRKPGTTKLIFLTYPACCGLHECVCVCEIIWEYTWVMQCRFFQIWAMSRLASSDLRKWLVITMEGRESQVKMTKHQLLLLDSPLNIWL